MLSIQNQKELITYLKNELGDCDCASGYASKVLYDVLKAIAERSKATKDQPTFSQKTRKIEEILQLDSSLGLGEWFVYFLEKNDLISHGFNSSDCWITEKGEILLSALRTFSLFPID